jgi:hypothetical protein
MTLMRNPTRFMLLAVLLGGCASAPATPINAVARGDLACDQVNVSEVADNRYQAVGCGRTGTYAKLCSGRHCSWVRVRSATEIAQSSGGYAPPVGSYGQRQIILAPPPQQREVIQAPPPAQPQPREIIAAPPPEAQATAPAQDAAAPQQPYTPQPTPLSQGELSQPYQTEVPLEPSTQRVEYPPPAPLVEVRPAPPQPSYVWVGGYWWWGNTAWTWAPGYWCAPRFGYNYIASSWYWNSGYWYFGPGGWARPGSTIIVGGVGPRPNRYVTSRSFTPRYVASAGGRMGTGPAYGPSSVARAPQRFTPQSSPMYRYPTSTSQRMGRMGTSMGGGPQRMGGYNGLTNSQGPGRFGAGSTTSSQRNYGYQPSRMGSSPQPRRMDMGPSSPSSSSFRSAPMMRMPSSPSPSRMGSPGGGGSFGRMGGGGGGGGGFGRMGGGGGGGGPARSAGGGRR